MKVQLGKRNARDEKTVKKKVVKDIELNTCWKKKLIFFDLPYWKSLHVTHCLDLVHLKKHVYEIIIGTLLNIPEKTKDSVAARKDLIRKGVWKSLALRQGSKKCICC